MKLFNCSNNEQVYIRLEAVASIKMNAPAITSGRPLPKAMQVIMLNGTYYDIDLRHHTQEEVLEWMFPKIEVKAVGPNQATFKAE